MKPYFSVFSCLMVSINKSVRRLSLIHIWKEVVLYDFGKETFGYITLKDVKGKGTIHIYYGAVSYTHLDVYKRQMVGPVEAEMRVPTALRKAHAANVDDQEGGEAIKGEGEKPIYAIQPSIWRHKDGRLQVL